MSKSAISMFKLELIKHQILNNPEALEEVLRSLEVPELKKVIILAEEVLASATPKFQFKKEDRDSWYKTFEGIYSDGDEHLVIERLEQIRLFADISFIEEYQYLCSWYQKELKMGGLYNFF